MTHRRTDPPGAASAGSPAAGARASEATSSAARGRGAPASGVHAHEMQATFRYLRLAIILLTLLLGVGVGMQIAADGGAVLMSVSAYYFTGARDVFVASLCAIGACLIIHRGRSDTEDALLNLSGYLAFVVAFVPTTPAQAVYDPGAQVAQVPIAPDVGASITQNTWAALAVGLVAFVLEMVLMPQRERRRHTRQGAVVRLAGAVGYLVLAGDYDRCSGVYAAPVGDDKTCRSAWAMWYIHESKMVVTWTSQPVSSSISRAKHSSEGSPSSILPPGSSHSIYYYLI